MLSSALPPHPLSETVTRHRRSSPARPHRPIIASNTCLPGPQHASPIRKAGTPSRADMWHTVPITRFGGHSNNWAIHNFHRSIHTPCSYKKCSEHLFSGHQATPSVDNSPVIQAADQQANSRRAKCVGGLTFSTLRPTHRATRRRTLVRRADGAGRSGRCTL